MKTYHINPCPAPRMTRSDKWKKRPCVMRYRAFRDQVKLAGISIPEGGYHIIFYIPMPKSWSKKKKTEMVGMPHQQVPDKDNLEKALLDAVFDDDKKIWDGRVSKIWGDIGSITVIDRDIHTPIAGRCVIDDAARYQYLRASAVRQSSIAADVFGEAAITSEEFDLKISALIFENQSRE